MDNDRSNSRTQRRDEPSKMDCVRKVWTEIRLALTQDEPLCSIHSRLQGSGIPDDYHTFATYVNRLRKAEKAPCDNEELTVPAKNGASSATPAVPVQLELEMPLETIAQGSDCGQALTSPAEGACENSKADKPDFYPGADVHLFLQGTAGIGKSVMASVLAQYLITRGSSVRCIDADPVNKTFSKYRGLGVERIELTDGGIVNTKRLDVLVNTILSANDKLVVDCGASTFTALQDHFRNIDLFARLTRAGTNVHIHAVITRGQAQDDTLDRFRELTQDEVRHRKIVVWMNEYFGPIEWDEKVFSETDLYHQRKHALRGLIMFPRRTAETFGHDIDLMIARHQTFTEAIQSADISIMARHRLEMVRDDLFKQLDAVWAVSLPGAT